jgi:Obg family GTPase CgtA
MPRTKQPGSEGEHRSLVLELKLIADVGLVGFPNAGKSTLLAALSNAQPRIAPYPFTTLHPNVGVVEYSDTKRLTMADIPGLVEGASDNKGLGHAFLRHIERTKLLLIVVDVSGSENGRPLRQLNALLDELRLYDESILSKPIVIFANKTDISSAFNEALLPASVALGEVSHPSNSVIEKKKRGRPPKTNSLLTAKTNANVKQLDPDAIAHFEQVAMLQELKKKAHALNVVLVSGSAEQGSGLAQLAHVIRVTLERGAI